jgi:hypothetical protein
MKAFFRLLVPALLLHEAPAAAAEPNIDFQRHAIEFPELPFATLQRASVASLGELRRRSERLAC